MQRWTFVLLLGSCFDPKLGPNPFACGPDNACPPGYSCHDGECLSGPSVPDAPLSIPDAHVSVPDAHVSVPDAPLSIPDARPPDAPRPQPDACSPAELLGNADFDSSSGPLNGRVITPWQSSQRPDQPSFVRRENEFPTHDVTTDTSPFSAVLGDKDNTTHILAQLVVVPANAQELRLTGKTWIVTDESSSGSQEFDTMNIDLLDQNGFVLERLAHFSNRSASNGWSSFAATAQSSHAGETVQLRILATNDDQKPTTFFVDTLSLIVPCN